MARKADSKKLEKWSKLLLDTGKKNNLINFKDRKASTLEMLLPESNELFEKIEDGVTLEIFNPKIFEDEIEGEDEENDEDLKETSPLKKSKQLKENGIPLREQYKNIHKNKIKGNKLLAFNSGETLRGINPINAAKTIYKKSKEFIDETGVNVSYIAFGFIHWKESDSSSYEYLAPILLLPVQLEKGNTIDSFTLNSNGDEVIVNPTFSYKLEAEYGVKLPEYENQGFQEYLDKVKRLVSKLKWQVTNEAKLGIFSFLKINMYRDINDNQELILKNNNIKKILGEEFDTEGDIASDDSNEKSVDTLMELHNVVDADSSQIEAIQMARSGRSFVLQGPPGTGKSQTITNIIAEVLSQGKKVLFVSEKLAALNVVHEKLHNVGLSEFCLELHSHKASKKEIIKEICKTLRLQKSSVVKEAENDLKSKQKAKQQLDNYEYELHKINPVINSSLFDLYNKFIPYENSEEVPWLINDLKNKGVDYLIESVSVLEDYKDQISINGYNYKDHPWYGYKNPEISFQESEKVKSILNYSINHFLELDNISKELMQKYEINCTSDESLRIWSDFFKFISSSTLITPKLLLKENINKVIEKIDPLKKLSKEIKEYDDLIDSEYINGIYEIEVEKNLNNLIYNVNTFFSRVLNSEYNSFLRQLKGLKKDRKKPGYKEAKELLERLSFRKKKMNQYIRIEKDIKTLLGKAYKGTDTDWDFLSSQSNEILSHINKIDEFGILCQMKSFEEDMDYFKEISNKIEKLLKKAEGEELKETRNYFDKKIFNIDKKSFFDIKEKLKSCVDNYEKLDNWIQLRELMVKFKKLDLIDFLDLVIKSKTPEEEIVKAFKKQFYGQWIKTIISESKVLRSFSRGSQDRAVKTFKEKDSEHFEINKAVIKSILSRTRPSLDTMVSNGPVSILLREENKKRKQKGIRTLLSETGELIQNLKPCFLMSPLSVSTFLDADKVKFDLVIFDEASQIFPQDAIGAIYRAKQLIVVGDSNQMPPSNFFNTSLEVEDEDEETGDVADFESILDLCKSSMNQLSLKWHYRSRFESLIAFSNTHFYNGDLVTFPSAKFEENGTGVDYYHVDGVFDRKTRTNRKEAERVVDLIFENIEKYPERSLGVVAFSISQQSLIDTLLTERRQNRPDKEDFFKNDENEPFFIKNLETVQGDERDTIIFSIAYGKDTQGKLNQNFGPLNRVGGERRLNVAITRAKCNVQLVSSMRCYDIDLSKTSSLGVKLLREYLDFAENGNIALERGISLNQNDIFDSEFELEVCNVLRQNGYEVDTQIGCSGYKIDLGVKEKDTSNYVLAIECDGATYHSSKNARDRDRLRQEILERMGWKFYRIWSTDWFKNKDVEIEKLLKEVEKAFKNKESLIEKKTKIEEKKNVSSNPIDQVEPKEQSQKFVEVLTQDTEVFPPYKLGDTSKFSLEYPEFLESLKAILEVESPLNQELLLKRILPIFGREKITDVIRYEFEKRLYAASKFGIISKNGFLYLKDKEIKCLRVNGDITRDIKMIAPEELGAGMIEVIRQNTSARRDDLYRVVASKCGVNRMYKTTKIILDEAFKTIESKVDIDGEVITLKSSRSKK